MLKTDTVDELVEKYEEEIGLRPHAFNLQTDTNAFILRKLAELEIAIAKLNRE